MSDHAQHHITGSQRILDDYETYGYHLGLIEDTDYLPGFVYSIGLYKRFGHPEIVCFGLKPEVTAGILNHAGDLIKEGKTFEPGILYSGFLQDYDIQFLPVNRDYYWAYFGYGGWFYNNSFDFPVLQLVWPDKQHLFPWEQGFNPNWIFRQPLLDRNLDFKFREERNLAVFTTRDVFKGNPILYVYHNDDGDWQFHSSDNPDIDDASVVALEEITKLDPSVNELFCLEYGESAWRTSRDSEWQIEKGSPGDQ